MHSTFRFVVAVSSIFVLLGAGRSTVARSANQLQTIAVVGGQPDDIAVDARGRLVWGNLSRGTIERLDRGRVVTAARGLSLPEGIVPQANGSLIVAEQGRDRVLKIDPGGKKSVIYALQPVAGQEGVDGIGRDMRTGELVIPDSPRGTVISTTVDGGRARVHATGLGRPVDAASDRYGDILVPDEHLDTVVVIGPRGRVHDRGRFATPDDVAVNRSGRVWVTSLGDGGLWEMTQQGSPRRVLAGLSYPQGLTLDRCGDPIVVEQNAGRVVRLLLTSKSAQCPY